MRTRGRSTCSASDFSGAPVCSLSIGGNEPVDGTGDGHTAPDWLVIDAHNAASAQTTVSVLK